MILLLLLLLFVDRFYFFPFFGEVVVVAVSVPKYGKQIFRIFTPKECLDVPTFLAVFGAKSSHCVDVPLNQS